MDFRDEKFLEILQTTTKHRESIGNLPFDIVLDDDRNYHNDEYLLFMGDHSKLKRLINKDGKSDFAMKIIKLSRIQKGQLEYLDLIQNEIKFLKRLDHPNIILMKDFFKDKKYFYIIYELAEYGNLLDYYRKTETFSEDDVFQFFFQILLAVDYLHKQGIIHRNLKLQNILLDVHHNLKLSNLKYACEEQNSTKLSKDFLEENLNYCPPEVLLSHTYHQKFDIWGLGIILYELLSKTSPFNGIIIEHTIHNILNESILIKGKLSEPLKNLLALLLAKDPIDRPSTEEILRHEWIITNLPKYDISFLQHPAFRNCHNIHDLMKYSQYDISPKVKVFPDIRKMTFFGKVNSKHKIFLIKNQEDENLKFPNIFYDEHFDRSYTQKSLNKSFDNKKTSRTTVSPNKQNKIFEPLRAPFQNNRFDEDEYDFVQHVKERNSLGNQEEQRFSHPVEIEKKKKNDFKLSTFADNSQKLYKSNDSYERKPDTNYSKGFNGDKNSRFFNKKDETNNNNNNTNNNYLINDMSKSQQNDYSGYSSKSNNRQLYFDKDFSNRNLYI